MSTLSSSSTFQNILDAYRDNASYEEDASVAKAKIFITACRLMLDPSRFPQAAGHAQEEVRLDLDIVKGQLEEAQEYVANGGARAAPESIILYGFDDYRE